MDMRLMKDRTSATNRPPRIAQPEVPAIGVVATADRGNELRTTGDGLGPSTSQGLEAALATARELLASTVEAVNPGTPRRELFAYLTQYRARLASLVAACPAGGNGDGA